MTHQLLQTLERDIAERDALKATIDQQTARIAELEAIVERLRPRAEYAYGGGQRMYGFRASIDFTEVNKFGFASLAEAESAFSRWLVENGYAPAEAALKDSGEVGLQ